MTRGQNFETMCGKDEWTAIPSAAALRAAVFALSAKKPEGGGGAEINPPGCARVKALMKSSNSVCMYVLWWWHNDTWFLAPAKAVESTHFQRHRLWIRFWFRLLFRLRFRHWLRLWPVAARHFVASRRHDSEQCCVQTCRFARNFAKSHASDRSDNTNYEISREIECIISYLEYSYWFPNKNF